MDACIVYLLRIRDFTWFPIILGGIVALRGFKSNVQVGRPQCIINCD